MSSNGSTTSRRDFLKGAALTSAALAGASFLSACSSGTSSENVSSDSATADSGRVTGYCGPGDWLGEAPAVADSQITDTIDVDVVILGNGHSGVGAAMGATDAGLTAAVIEKQAWSTYVNDKGDGTNMAGWYGEDIGHVNSQFLIDRGFGPYDTGEIVSEFCKRGAGRVNPDIIKAYVQNSGAMFDRYHAIYNLYGDEREKDDSAVYLTSPIDGNSSGTYDLSDMFQYPLCNTQACYSGANVSYPISAGGYKTWPCNAQFYGMQGNNIEYVHKYIVQHAQENGATYYFEHTGVVLTQDSDGAVTGLIAQDSAGNYKRFNAAKGVILCAGDYIGNPEMCWALLNEGMEWGERSGSTNEDWTQSGSRIGDGHKMGCWAGGMVEPSPRGWMAIGAGCNGPWGAAPILQLNAEGKRFSNEAAIAQAGPVDLRQPAGAACWVSDANWSKTVASAPLDHGAPNFGMDDFYTDLKADMDACVVGPTANQVIGAALGERRSMKGSVFAANTLEDLATYLGYTGDAATSLLASIKAYNTLCEAGVDSDYGKDAKYMVPIDTPPYYGGTGTFSHSSTPMMVTMSGLVTDAHQNVLDTSWEPIKGLYAAGNCLGGRYGFGYSTPFAGNSVGMAITHGWLAARTIAGVA